MVHGHVFSFGASWRAGVWLLAACGVAGLLATACGTVTRTVVVPPMIEGSEFVGNVACVACHEEYTRIYGGSAHGRYYRENDPRWAQMTGCESCHGPGSRHVETGSREFIVNPGKDPSVCFQCHIETHMEFGLAQRHPVLEGRMTCVECHDVHGPDIMRPVGGLGMARLNESCAECHRDQARPFVFEHAAMREGCVVCHEPHGSVNRALLRERDSNLCLKCHAQVQAVPGRIFIGRIDHTEHMRWGTCFSAGCHTAVHGSNVSPALRH
jgi:predicted CXXCH cytochrome family protein